PLDAGVIDAERRIDQKGERYQEKQDARGANGIAARRKESDEARWHSEIIGVAFLEADWTWRVTANALEGMRRQNRRCRDGKHAGADQHEPPGQVLGYPHLRRHSWLDVS